MSSMTTIVRTFFENMSSKPKKQGLHTQNSSELYDSGIQVKYDTQCCISTFK